MTASGSWGEAAAGRGGLQAAMSIGYKDEPRSQACCSRIFSSMEKRWRFSSLGTCSVGEMCRTKVPTSLDMSKAGSSSFSSTMGNACVTCQSHTKHTISKSTLQSRPRIYIFTGK